jgi:hypothetical protein
MGTLARYGDGWSGNKLTVHGQDFTLSAGSSATFEACLPPGLYSPTCCGGTWKDEVSWAISLKASGTALLAGGADDACAPVWGSFTIESSGGGGNAHLVMPEAYHATVRLFERLGRAATAPAEL